MFKKKNSTLLSGLVAAIAITTGATALSADVLPRKSDIEHVLFSDGFESGNTSAWGHPPATLEIIEPSSSTSSDYEVTISTPGFDASSFDLSWGNGARVFDEPFNTFFQDYAVHGPHPFVEGEGTETFFVRGVAHNETGGQVTAHRFLSAGVLNETTGLRNLGRLYVQDGTPRPVGENGANTLFEYCFQFVPGNPDDPWNNPTFTPNFFDMETTPSQFILPDITRSGYMCENFDEVFSTNDQIRIELLGTDYPKKAKAVTYILPGIDNVPQETVLTVNPLSNEHNVLAHCRTPFVAETIEWNWGDGTIETKHRNDMPSAFLNSVPERFSGQHHTYLESGSYDITCNATDGAQSSSANTQVNIDTEATLDELVVDGTVQPYPLRVSQNRISPNTYSFNADILGMATNGARYEVDASASGTDSLGPWEKYFDFSMVYPGGSSVAITIPFGDAQLSGYVSAGRNYQEFAPRHWNEGIIYGCSNSHSLCISTTANINGTIPMEPDPANQGGLYMTVEGMSADAECRIPNTTLNTVRWEIDGDHVSELQGETDVTLDFDTSGEHHVQCIGYSATITKYDRDITIE